MDIQLTLSAVHDLKCDALVVGIARQNTLQGASYPPFPRVTSLIDNTLGGLIKELCTDGEFKGKLGELLTIHPMGRLAIRRVIIVGLGAEEALNLQTIRRASATAARHLQNTGAQKIALAIQWSHANFDEFQNVQAQIEGALLGLYTFKKYQTSENNSKNISQIQLLTDGANKTALEQALHKGRLLADATNFTRDLVNEPPNVLTPSALANHASTMAKQFGLECEVFDKAKIQGQGMGGLLAVSQGSAQPPHFIILRYRGAPQNTSQTLALVGKGVTFDTGGISLKPVERMDEMKSDMAGAAAVLGAMQAIASLHLPLNVTALIPTCENMPGSTAYCPGDILRIMNGKTIEIINTDAEGRLILADALSYAAREGLSPIIDLATLTGGIVVALGNTMAGLFSNDEQLTTEILAAGRMAGEKYWPMPLDDEYGEQIKSDIADIKQVAGRKASAITAAKILEHFVGNTKWAHLDIAGISYRETKNSYQEKGATGAGVRTLAELAERLAKVN